LKKNMIQKKKKGCRRGRTEREGKKWLTDTDRLRALLSGT